MTEKQKKLLYWLVIGLLASILFYLLLQTLPFYQVIFSFIFTILTPLLISAFIAYLLFPLVEGLNHHFLPRWAAILSLYIIIFGGIAFGIYKAYPVFVRQLKELIENIPHLMDTYQAWTYNLYVQTSHFPEEIHDKMDQAFLSLEESLLELLTSVVYSLTRISDIFVIAAVIPILVFYLLKDFPKIKAALISVVPTKKGRVQKFLKDIDQSLGGYLRGQLLVCLFVAIISSILLWLIHMKYPLLLGTFMGLTNIIPYFGPILGAVPAVIIAFTISANKVLYVIIVVLVVQLIEGNLLSPFIVGKTLHVHPVLIIFALLIGAEAFGIIGMILAVPVLTIIKVILEPTKIIQKVKQAWAHK
ncbi:putative PurR-regulated permease PerM [Salirhabdus euzebyi]|uniref:Putative PurR-regulated permease PerM n=1 Tax=Salirhabdus euzebyi TaxID=394506 RepID=A0A841Q7V9_9BACI|nr:AI-2E family transporter [Salirhabdus euzebyi]MBB6454372.1 putative PurR-regulated permease PerM [Salirhabdus euzebyi]